MLNSVGYKVLPSYLRIIQGDGIDLNSVDEVLIRASLLRYVVLYLLVLGQKLLFYSYTVYIYNIK